MPLVLGVDSSTQSTKVEARDVGSGEVVGRAFALHPPTQPPVSEQDPQSWWIALVDAVTALGAYRDDIVGVSIAAQQHGLVLVGEHGEVLRPAKLWNDVTSAPQADRLVSELGASAWATRCGSVPVAAFTIAKLAWVAEHEPEVLDATRKVMLPHDYLTWRLTGRHVTDRGDASGTGWFNPVSDTYDLELVTAAAGGPVDDWFGRLPTVLGHADQAGELGGEAAQALGLAPGIAVGAGSGDNMAAALGMGMAAGDVAISLGTSGTVYSVSATPTADDTGAVAGFASASGEFLPLVCTLNATKVTDTVAGWLGTDAAGLGELAMAATAAEPPCVLLPYFDGERVPNLPTATGTFFGLRADTTREQLALAAHDGVLCGLLDGLDALKRNGVAHQGRLLVTGGGGRSAAYRQRLADLVGGSVTVPEVDEAVATGAAVQAAMVVNGQSESTEVAQAWGLRTGSTVEPAADATSVREAFASCFDSLFA